MKEEAEKPDFCNGHSPAVTITFVCPSERREVSDLSLSYFKDVILRQTCPNDHVSVFEACKGGKLKDLALWVGRQLLRASAPCVC